MMSSGPSVTPHRSGTFTDPSGFRYRSTQSRAPSAAARNISRSASAHAGAGIASSMTMALWPSRWMAAIATAIAATHRTPGRSVVPHASQNTPTRRFPPEDEARDQPAFFSCSENAAPCGSRQLTMRSPPGTSIGPLRIFPPPALTRRPRLEVGDAEVEAPVRRHLGHLGRLVHHPAQRAEMAAEHVVFPHRPHVHRLGRLPAEQVAVELQRRGGVGGHQLDPRDARPPRARLRAPAAATPARRSKTRRPADRASPASGRPSARRSLPTARRRRAGPRRRRPARASRRRRTCPSAAARRAAPVPAGASSRRRSCTPPARVNIEYGMPAPANGVIVQPTDVGVELLGGRQVLGHQLEPHQPAAQRSLSPSRPSRNRGRTRSAPSGALYVASTAGPVRWADPAGTNGGTSRVKGGSTTPGAPPSGRPAPPAAPAAGWRRTPAASSTAAAARERRQIERADAVEHAGQRPRQQQAATRPTTPPAATRARCSPITSATVSPRRAPSAMRRPISRVRCVTEYDSTP